MSRFTKILSISFPASMASITARVPNIISLCSFIGGFFMGLMGLMGFMGLMGLSYDSPPCLILQQFPCILHGGFGECFSAEHMGYFCDAFFGGKANEV